VTQKAFGIFLEPSCRANGQYFDGKGNLLAAADERDQLWQITPDGTELSGRRMERLSMFPTSMHGSHTRMRFKRTGRSPIGR
jgi:hypothetical protein